MINVFDLPGPSFLLFYVITSAAALSLLQLLIRALESKPMPRLGTPDPYEVAYLRGGADEAIRVATLSLVDRGLLEVDGANLKAVPGAGDRVRRSLERAVLSEFGGPSPAWSALHGNAASGPCRGL